jgi:hypothetical protein
MTRGDLRAPSLRIDLTRDGNALLIRRGTDDKGEEIPCRLLDKYAREYRATLKRGLDQMKSMVRNPSPGVRDAHNALGALNRVGLTLLWQVFRNEIERVVRIFQNSYPSWDTATEPFAIDLSAELGRFVPVEFLPLFELSEWPTFEDVAGLARAARRFPGFSAVIRRQFTDLSVDQDLVLKNEPKLPLKCFSYSGLGGAGEEVRFFTEIRDGIDLDGPWPTGPMTVEEFSRSLATHLRYADQRFDGGVSPGDQIQHFACHCEIDEEVASASRLRFSFGNEVTIADLESYFPLLGDKRRPAFRPLIFLNACGGSQIDPVMVTSFPRFFLEENGNRGFIGTETNVSDSLAARFSMRFYEELLSGATLGEAVHRAKWTMLTKHNNPLGILYTVYADPELRLSQPIARVGTE